MLNGSVSSMVLPVVNPVVNPVVLSGVPASPSISLIALESSLTMILATEDGKLLQTE